MLWFRSLNMSWFFYDLSFDQNFRNLAVNYLTSNFLDLKTLENVADITLDSLKWVF